MEEHVSDEDPNVVCGAPPSLAEPVPDVVVSEGQETRGRQPPRQVVVPGQVLPEPVAQEHQALQDHLLLLLAAAAGDADALVGPWPPEVAVQLLLLVPGLEEGRLLQHVVRGGSHVAVAAVAVAVAPAPPVAHRWTVVAVCLNRILLR